MSLSRSLLDGFLLCAICCSIRILAAQPPANRTTLYLLGLAPVKDNFNTRYLGPGAAGVFPLVELAIEHVNSRPDVLSGYTLDYLAGDSGCVVNSQATGSLVGALSDRARTVVGVVGPLCSTAASVVAPLVAREEISLMQFTAATSPLLSAPSYSNTIQGVGNSKIFVQAFLRIAKRYGWSRVATLHETERLFFVTTNEAFREGLQENGYSVSSQFVSKTSLVQQDELRALKTRIIVVFAASDITTKIVCLAHSKYMDITYPSYMFFFPDKEPEYLMRDTTFTHEGRLHNCTKAEMIESLNGAVFASIRLKRPENTPDEFLLESGVTYGQYKEQALRKLSGQEEDAYAGAYYDGVWSLALALNNSIQHLQEVGHSLPGYRWGQSEATAVIRQQLLGLNFEGASGRIYLNADTREGEPILDFVRILPDANGNFVPTVLGFYDTPEATLHLVNGTVSEFIDDEFPVVLESIHWSYGAIVLLLVLLVLILTALLHGLNYAYRENKKIKATSPALNHLIFSGCYLFLVALLAHCFLESFYFRSGSLTLYAVLCNVVTWCFPVGFSLIYGTICVKTLRIYIFFFRGLKRHNSRFLSDEGLTVFVLLLVALDIIVCLVWSAVDPWLFRERIIVSRGTEFVSTMCECNHLVVWAVILGLYKLLLVAIVIFLSILTRRVDRKEFLYSKNINILAYSFALTYAMGIPTGLVLYTAQIYVSFTVIYCVFFSSILLCHLTLFLPPMLPIFYGKTHRPLW